MRRPRKVWVVKAAEWGTRTIQLKAGCPSEAKRKAARVARAKQWPAFRELLARPLAPVNPWR